MKWRCTALNDPHFLLAFDFGGTKLAIATTDTSGTILHQSQIKVSECEGGADALSQALVTGRELADRLQYEGRIRLAGIGVSTMGITLADQVLMAPNISGWESLQIPAAFEASFPGVPVRITNDMKAGALAELRRGALRGSRAGIYVNTGTGLGVTLTLGNQVVEGAHGAAGELAYNLVSNGSSVGFRDGITPLENYAGGRGIGQRASVRFGQDMTCEEAFHLSHIDAGIHEFIDDTLRELAFHLTNLAIAWDPDKVVFGGGMVASRDVIFPPVIDYFQRFVPFPPAVEVALFKDNAGLQGAIELARDASRK